MLTTHEEFFNMKHFVARNVIERCFGFAQTALGYTEESLFLSSEDAM